MNEDPTEPQGGDQYGTTPGVTAILERINQVHTNLLERINQNHAETLQNDAAMLGRINQGDSAILELISEVRGELLERINQVHAETRQSNSTMLNRFNDIEGQVRLTNHKLDVVREDLFNAKVQVGDVQARVDELERKVS